MIRNFFLASVLLLAPILATSQYSTKKPGSGESFYPGPGGVSSVYDTATSVWTFNDPADLGADSVGSNDLTLVNTPTATGGALGYATQYEAASNQYSYINDNDSISGDNASDIAVCFWFNVGDAQESNEALLSKYGLSGKEWLFYITSNSIQFAISVNGTSFSGQDSLGVLLLNTRLLVCGWNDVSASTIYSTANDDTFTSGASITGAIQNTTQDLEVARWYSSGYIYGTNTSGPIYFWKGDLGDFTTIRDSIYNSGKGKACAALSAAEKVNLVSCWDMDEDGGPYVDSIGSNDLTAVNTPTRAAGLVERSDSGMALRPDKTAGSYLGDADFASLSFTGNFTMAVWLNTPDDTFNHSTVSKELGGSREYFAYVEDIVGKFNFILFDGSGSVTAIHQTNLFGDWHLVVFWYDSSDRKIRILVDDSGLVASSALSVGNLVNGDAQFRIGSSQFVSISSTPTDNVAVWTNLLSAADRTTLYNSGAGTFYAAFLDMIFNGPRFAWSQPPQIRRLES